MEIIPVIDVLGGKVVHARGGVRSQYPLLQSVLTSHCEPLKVINDVLGWQPFSTIYVADLDAILQQQHNIELYKSLAKDFPRVTFLLDAGIDSKESWQHFLDYPNIKPVIGSETLVDIGWLADSGIQQKSILSLDFQHGQFLGDQQLLQQPEVWAENIIAMNIDHIGSHSGPDFELLASLQRQAINSQIIAAGGVRSEQDLIDLELQGVGRVLIASALHDGRITKRSVDKV
ncbi:MAG: HisA/HisF-related TIM barrel protein [Pseudomonadota bacterium]|nr:HisA/HisF-related TIM barrel protein [Pseudomonadota bacterium]MDO7667718.1 HisA/HisF-related TIM barrel protein [Pseudomonadota bacterium]MDO7711401.1 HisA/HisF-related TIM barrel protein [Pseudomonadota bacterium]